MEKVGGWVGGVGGWEKRTYYVGFPGLDFFHGVVVIHPQKHIIQRRKGGRGGWVGGVIYYQPCGPPKP